MKKKKCEACSEYFATVATVADPLKKGENLYLCQKCHEDLHCADTKIISYHH
jgi:predicted SprT family Zn-dependent metalloprotease